MASKRKQKDMVLRQERATTPAAATAAEHPAACSILSTTQKAKEGGWKLRSHQNVTNKERDMTGKEVSMSPVLSPVKQPTSLHSQQEPLSPVSFCKGIKVTLDNNSMWNEFYRCRTEMILTKQGSRMFPYCRFRISGLQSAIKYSLIMDIQPLDNSCYKWTGSSWQAAGKAEGHKKSPPFAHPESPSTGEHWMQNPVSFYRLKLTNSISEGNIFLHPMHRYLPRLHIIPTDKATKDIKLTGPSVVTFTFTQTEFMAVTAYQNSKFAQLKVDYNPFAKGLKEELSGSMGQKLKLNSGKDLHKEEPNRTNPLKTNLKSLLANHKRRSLKLADSKSLPPGDTTNKIQSTARVPEESLCSGSPPAQKLFSELIREAHVSLQRCNMEEISANSTSRRTKLTHMEDENQQTPSANKSDCVLMPRKLKTTTRQCLDVEIPKKTDICEVVNVSQKSCAETDHQPKLESSSKVNVEKKRCTAALPLPALARFLKQHSTKSKKSNIGPPPTVTPDSKAQISDKKVPEGNLVDIVKESNSFTNDPTCEPVKVTIQPTSLSSGTAENIEPTVPDAGNSFDSISTSENPNFRPTDIDGPPVLCTLEDFTPTVSSLLSTSDDSPVLSHPIDTVLHVNKSPQTRAITESSTLLPNSPTIRSVSSLPDPECSSFTFEPMSPASSPEPLPALADSFTLELESTLSQQGQKPGTSDLSTMSEGPSTSVFQWHTVLPPSVPSYMDTAYTPFSPTSQTLSFSSVTPPLLHSPPPIDPVPQILQPALSIAASDSISSFQIAEQSLPFPGELSPLVLQLPLSPTFSSIDGDVLSPAPSLTDLVQFFSVSDELGMEVEFSNSGLTPAPAPAPASATASCSPTSKSEENAPEPCQDVEPPKKSCKRRKISCMQKPSSNGQDQRVDGSYANMQPNMEEVEEQLFVSFTSKEALKLHIPDSLEESHHQPMLESHPLPPTETPESADDSDAVRQKIYRYEKNLLRDLKLVKHRQVIHPVLQEVGIKLNLLDPTLAIDLQYLGVHLPIPPPGVGLEPLTQELTSSQGTSAAFVSRTGKTTDVTLIKGWREKFSPPEAPPTPMAKPEVSSSSDLPKKNLSAFCSDMLDEYLENEGKLIDERAASFCQPQEEQVPYELPAQSTSYVRTLDSVLKKHGPPTSDLISGFIPPSKRPKVSPPERKTRDNLKGSKLTRMRQKPASPLVSSLEQSPAETNQVSKLPAGMLMKSKQTAAITESYVSRLTVQFNHTEPISVSPENHNFKGKRMMRRYKTSGQTLPPLQDDPSGLEPIESDTEVSRTNRQQDKTPVMTRALLRQKDLEDGVVWEGQPRTSITKERATIALTSLFTLMGFVSENPTAPIQLGCSRAPPCLNDYCRLGCICSSLAYSYRMGHCGRPQCMFGCSCLKQKVVLLKNLDCPDLSPLKQGSNKKSKRRKRRMKMAYVLKEAETVSQPAERVHVLWKKENEDLDPEPTYIPQQHSQTNLTRPVHLQQCLDQTRSCARVRAYTGKGRSQKLKEKNESLQLKPHTPQTSDEVRSQSPSLSSAAEQSQPPPSVQPPIPQTELPSKPSKRLIILAECKWTSEDDRNQVLKSMCEAMALDRLNTQFWVKDYLITPISQTVEEGNGNCCVQYKVHISRPTLEQEEVEKPLEQSKEAETEEHMTNKDETSENRQNQVEESDTNEEQGSTSQQNNSGSETSGQELRKEAKTEDSLALPLLTGISPAGFLSAKVKQPGGTDHVVEVNGKLYPLAKIQLGKMGALHPANRLAAYLTGRVGSIKKQLQTQTISPTTQTTTTITTSPATSTSTGTSSQPQSMVPGTLPSTSSTGNHQAAVRTQPDGEEPEGSRTQIISVKVYPVSGSGQVRVLPATSGGSAPSTVSQVIHPGNLVSSSKITPDQKAIPSPRPKAPLSGVSSHPVAQPPPGQRVLLKPVSLPSGKQFYRFPDGKVVQLVPLNKMKAETPAQFVLRGCSPTALPRLPLQTPAVTVQNQKSTTTSATLPSAAPASSLSGFQSFSVSPLPSPLSPGSGFLSQKGTCTFKILPASTKTESIVIKCSPLPLLPPEKLPLPNSPTHLKLKPPESTAPPFPTGGSVPSHGPQSEFGTTATPSPASDSVVTEPEVAEDPLDLDIVCVDDDGEIVVDPEPLSSGETENSSDFSGESASEEVLVKGGRQRLAIDIKRVKHKRTQRQHRKLMMHKFKRLREEVGFEDDRVSKFVTLNKAMQVIKDLRTTETNLMLKKRDLKKKRDSYLATLVPSSEHQQHFSKERETELENIDQATNQLPEEDSDDDVIILSSQQPQQTPIPPDQSSDQAQLSVTGPKPAGSTSASVQSLVPTLVQPVHSVLKKSRGAAPVIHRGGVRERQKTVPNILSRKRKPSPSPLKDTLDSPPITAVVPADVLTLVGTALPGQKLLTLGPVMDKKSFLQPTTGMVTLNIPSVTNKIKLDSLLYPTSAAKLLHLVPELPQLSPASPLVLSAGTNLTSQKNPDKNQQHNQNQEKVQGLIETNPKSPISSSSPPSTGGGACFLDPGVEPEGGPEGLKTLLNELVFLNQNTVSTATKVEMSSEAVNVEGEGCVKVNCTPQKTEGAMLQEHTEGTPSRTTNGNTTKVVLTPPPLLQMKVGEAISSDSIPSHKATAGEGAGGHDDASPSWRPMPRLVPLGVKGAPPI